MQSSMSGFASGSLTKVGLTRRKLRPKVHPWSNMAIAKCEIQNILTFLAYKLDKPVTFRCYTEDERREQKSACIHSRAVG